MFTQYNDNITIRIAIINNNSEVLAASQIGNTSIRELYFESNLYLGFPYISAIFHDSDGIFICKDVSNGSLYMSIYALGNGNITTETEYFKVVSWDTFSSGMVRVNLAVPSLYFALLKDSYRKVFKKGLTPDMVYRDLLDKVGGTAFIPKKLTFEPLPYDLPKFTNSIVFMKDYLLALTKSKEVGNNDFHFYVKNNKICIIAPCLFTEKPFFRLFISNKVKGYEDVGEENNYTSDWIADYFFSLSDGFDSSKYIGFTEKDSKIEEKDFDTSLLQLSNPKGFNFLTPTPDEKNKEIPAINYPKNFLDYNTINSFNKNFLCTVATPLNVVFQPNIVYELNTTFGDSALNSWFMGNIWAYSVIHKITIGEREGAKAITIIKGIKNGHLHTQNGFPNAKSNPNIYEVTGR